MEDNVFKLLQGGQGKADNKASERNYLISTKDNQVLYVRGILIVTEVFVAVVSAAWEVQVVVPVSNLQFASAPEELQFVEEGTRDVDGGTQLLTDQSDPGDETPEVGGGSANVEEKESI